MRRDQCSYCDKVKFRTYPLALSAALSFSKRFSTPYRIYPCPRGRGFHLTTQRRKDHEEGAIHET